ncbi:Ubiquinone/menaquinone biosynthesis C-methylase UbiE [Bryocella elongata]|uniref:Ubiquinone/menaquinone biosynthesis C-methylase UbiE n=1 Tax=Bryocella elongata TaxID=863522 RepID=A0A1H6BZE2_9BACT|nr:class I SAM-dependent methyltransferase [Bryocella elongata]SEG66074.1 Ubiquinone/menaquinone biosynthesis C-methylase UbiE [Bryocella elongata]
MDSQPNFDRIAHLYRWSEYLALGRLLEQVRFHLLPRLQDRTNALVLGDGDGRFLARLMTQNPALHATAIDISAKMLDLLRARCLRTSPAAGARLHTLRTSALEADAPPQTDLIATHFLLDCLTQQQVDELTQRLAAQVQPGCLWVVSDFEVPQSPVLGFFGALYVRTLYLAFRMLTGLRVTHLPDPQQALAAAGFARIERQERLGGLLYTELWVRL